MSTERPGLLSASPPTDLFDLDHQYFDTVRYFANRLSGCWHLELARPFTHGRETYRACLRCGMHRGFDTKIWKSSGRFYSPSVERRARL